MIFRCRHRFGKNFHEISGFDESEQDGVADDERPTTGRDGDGLPTARELARAADILVVIDLPLGQDLPSGFAFQDADPLLSSLGELVHRHLGGQQFHADWITLRLRRDRFGLSCIGLHTCVFKSCLESYGLEFREH